MFIFCIFISRKDLTLSTFSLGAENKKFSQSLAKSLRGTLKFFFSCWSRPAFVWSFFTSSCIATFYAVSSVELVFNLLESADGLSGDASSSFAGPFSSSGAQGSVDLQVELAESLLSWLGEDGDLVTFLDDLGAALCSFTRTVGHEDFCLELINVFRILAVLHIKDGVCESLKNSI